MKESTQRRRRGAIWNEMKLCFRLVFFIFSNLSSQTHTFHLKKTISPRKSCRHSTSVFHHHRHTFEWWWNGQDSSKTQPNFPFLLLALKWINVKHKHTGKHFEYPWDPAKNKQAAEIIKKRLFIQPANVLASFPFSSVVFLFFGFQYQESISSRECVRRVSAENIDGIFTKARELYPRESSFVELCCIQR